VRHVAITAIAAKQKQATEATEMYGFKRMGAFIFLRFGEFRAFRGSVFCGSQVR
jgi:hypothetical protein